VANYRPGATDLTAFSAGTAWGRLAWRPRGTGVLQVSYTRQDAGTILYPYLQMDAPNDDADRAGLRYEAAEGPGGWESIGVSLYFTRVDHWMTDEYRSSAAGTPAGYSMATSALTESIGGRLEGRWHALSLGMEAARRRWDTTTRLAARQYAPQRSLADAAHESVGAYAELSRPIATRGTLELGARLDRVRTHVEDAGANTALYRAYSGSAATSATDLLGGAKARLAWQWPWGMKTGIGAGRTARSPDQQERYFALSRMGTDWAGRPDLRPAANTGLELEWEIARHGRLLTASAFVWRVDDFIVARAVTRREAIPGVMNARARSFANADAALRGAEVTASTPLGARLAVRLSFAAVRGSERGPGSPPLAEMPPVRAAGELRYDDGRFGLVLEGVAVADQTRIDPRLGETPTPGYAVFNARGSVKHGRLAIAASVGNLLDRLYTEHLSYQRDPFRNGVRVYEPGRTAHVNVSFGF
jgi:iron complex outermembrane receptor protein